MLLFAANYTRMIRAQTMETLNEDYVRTARAKGTPEWLVMRSHVMRERHARRSYRRSAWTSASRSAARSSPRRSSTCRGLGGKSIESITNFDLPIIAGIVVFGTMAIIVFNLFVDLLAWIDRNSQGSAQLAKRRKQAPSHSSEVKGTSATATYTSARTTASSGPSTASRSPSRRGRPWASSVSRAAARPSPT